MSYLCMCRDYQEVRVVLLMNIYLQLFKSSKTGKQGLAGGRFLPALRSQSINLPPVFANRLVVFNRHPTAIEFLNQKFDLQGGGRLL